jgi:putative flippase GtrA
LEHGFKQNSWAWDITNFWWVGIGAGTLFLLYFYFPSDGEWQLTSAEAMTIFLGYSSRFISNHSWVVHG